VIAIDTGPLVALCDARDAKHAIAAKDLARLVRQEFGVCDAVLTETCFHLPHRSQRLRLRGLLDELKVRSLPNATDERFWGDAFDWLVKYADQEPDWADACLAVLSARDAQLRVWTYDREFRLAWRRPDGSAIPLAVRHLSAS
jgi:predicted nucleic acid-binding protein